MVGGMITAPLLSMLSMLSMFAIPAAYRLMGRPGWQIIQPDFLEVAT